MRSMSIEILLQGIACEDCEKRTLLMYNAFPMFLYNRRIDMNFLIKITDFGLSEDVFERNYFRQGSGEEAVKLPVKWMAPESLSDCHFSEKSDVVGFQN